MYLRLRDKSFHCLDTNMTFRVTFCVSTFIPCGNCFRPALCFKSDHSRSSFWCWYCLSLAWIMSSAQNQAGSLQKDSKCVCDCAQLYSSSLGRGSLVLNHQASLGHHLIPWFSVRDNLDRSFFLSVYPYICLLYLALSINLHFYLTVYINTSIHIDQIHLLYIYLSIY